LAISPANATNATLPYNISCLIYDNFNPRNLTVWSNATGAWAAYTPIKQWPANNTPYNFTFSYSLSGGAIKWTCFGCDESGNCAMNATNYTLFITPVVCPTTATNAQPPVFCLNQAAPGANAAPLFATVGAIIAVGSAELYLISRRKKGSKGFARI